MSDLFLSCCNSTQLAQCQVASVDECWINLDISFFMLSLPLTQVVQSLLYESFESDN